jgi:hypothetical protein
MIKEGNNKDLINKFASTVSLQAQSRQIGEVAEFQSLLHSLK